MEAETSTGEPSPPPGDRSAAAVLVLRHAMRRRRGADPAAPPGVPRAAVALVLRAGDAGLEILLIKRAERDDDPWSGHIAFPGGREDPVDRSLEETAIRETREEIGLDLASTGEVLGVLDDLQPASLPQAIVVRPFVALLHTTPPLVLSDEVAAVFWVPMAAVTAAGAIVESVVHVRGMERRVTSFRHGEHVIWGMTERILRQLLTALTPPSFA
jgi:8-oxo-dGTP pyrophosphatase MutT (NUDIX family)